MEKNLSKTFNHGSIEELFGNILKQLRNDKNLSQESLGFESGYHRTYISLLERGKKSPSLKTIFQLAKALGIKPSEIMDRLQALYPDYSKKKHPRGRVKK
ncbi:MAG: helix-turn-helix transcriptional regulator [Deltaproteobacteria bacterium]|nr:helix-turn-helix transcriptional regulator [Deltaproteobacteria bacterium]